MTLDSPSDSTTEAIGRSLARHLGPGVVVALYGDLGAGKTVLARGIARGLGIDEPVTSPTFTIVQEYSAPNDLLFYHLDLYRIGSVDEALAFGIEDFLFAPNAIAAVEWPGKIAPLLEAPEQSARGCGNANATEPPKDIPPGTVVTVFLEHVGPAQRRIRLPDEFSGTVVDFSTHGFGKGRE